MAFEGIITRLNLLFNDMENQPEDEHELLEQIHLELSQLKATGQPLPDDLLELEQRLNEEFEKRGRVPGASGA